VLLVAPRHYAYKSIKHLVSIDFRVAEPRVLAKEHPRARVALEERHPRLPAAVVCGPYRLLIPPTACLAERSLRRHQASAAD
jgi:DMSO/TMAO reductase YedYZ molybdopterin-dependent catalytic subunit